ADEVERLTLALRDSRPHARPRPHETEMAALIEAVRLARESAPDDETLYAFSATAQKLQLADNHTAALAQALDRASPPSAIASELDLSLFRADTPRGLAVLMEQFHYRSPALRYGVRLSLAMSAGYALTW